MNFCLPHSLSALLNLVLGLPLVEPRFLHAIGLLLKACLNISRVNMNGSKECLPALSTTVPSEKKIDGIWTESFFLLSFVETSDMLFQNQFHHIIYIYPRGGT